jgi:prepilin-type N-terminal cleavage/methylation domain-containing protein
MSKERGYSYLEMIVVLVVLGVLATMGIRAFDRMIEEASASSLITTVIAVGTQARNLAIMRNTYTGVSFQETTEGVTARIYRDGDQDGLSNQDIQRGVDQPEGASVALKIERARVGLPEAVRTDPEGGPLTDRDGVHFGRSNLLSFGPTGTATPGTLYLAAGEHEAWAFRVSPLSGRIRVYRWRFANWSLVEGH